MSALNHLKPKFKRSSTKDGKVVGGLEAEIDLGETMKQLKLVYANYERDVAIVSLSLLVFSLLLVWVVLRRQD